MSEIETSEALLGRVIATQGTADFMQHLNAWLFSVAGQDNTTLLAYYKDQTPQLLMSNSYIPEVHRHMKNVYLAGAYLLDPFYEVHRRKEKAGLYRIWDIAPDQFPRNRYFIEYYRRTTIVDEIGFVVWPKPEVSIHVCLGRDARSNQQFSSSELSAARAIAPVVEALVKRQWPDIRFVTEREDESVPQRIARLVSESRNINLTNRQSEVAFHVLQGHSSTSIGLRLGISTQTVKVFRKQLYKRCGVSSQAELFGLLLPILTLNNDPFELSKDTVL